MVTVFAALAMTCSATHGWTKVPEGKIGFRNPTGYYTMNTDGGGVIKATGSLEQALRNVDPYGGSYKRVRFSPFFNGEPKVSVANIDGSDRREISVDDEPWCEFLSFTADNSKIIYYYNSNTHPLYREIHVMSIDGTGHTRLAYCSEYCMTPPHVSPDRRRIVFVSPNGPDQKKQNQQIYTINADGTGLTRLTFSSSNDYSPFFNADGSRIAFASFRDGGWELYIMNADGSNQTRITHNIGPGVDEIMLCWFPSQGPVVISVDDVSIPVVQNEATRAVFTVSLSGPCSLPVAVNYHTEDGTAIEGVDYTLTKGTLLFSPYETTKTVTVPIYKGISIKRDKTFSLLLDNAIQVELTNSKGMATLVDGGLSR